MNNRGAKRARTDDDSSDDINFSDSSDEEVAAQAVVRTIEVEVRPLGGGSFKVLNNDKPSVGEAKAEVASVQGIQVVQSAEEKTLSRKRFACAMMYDRTGWNKQSRRVKTPSKGTQEAICAAVHILLDPRWGIPTSAGEWGTSYAALQEELLEGWNLAASLHGGLGCAPCSFDEIPPLHHSSALTWTLDSLLARGLLKLVGDDDERVIEPGNLVAEGEPANDENAWWKTYLRIFRAAERLDMPENYGGRICVAKAYRGVRPTGKKWRANIKHDGKTTNLGTFEDEQEAAMAYDRAARASHGEKVQLNFPTKTERAAEEAAEEAKQQRWTACRKAGSKHQGVGWHTARHKWRATINYGGKTITLGCFEDEEEAARAYDKAATAHKGEKAQLNFPAAEGGQEGSSSS
jgi:hypothetical protein